MFFVSLFQDELFFDSSVHIVVCLSSFSQTASDGEVDGDVLGLGLVLGELLKLELGEGEDDGQGLDEGDAETDEEGEGLLDGDEDLDVEGDDEGLEIERVSVPSAVNLTHVSLPFVPVEFPPV